MRLSGSVRTLAGVNRESLASARSDDVVAPLIKEGVLSEHGRPVAGVSACQADTDDLLHVRALFAAQVPGKAVLGVYRIEGGAFSEVYGAVRRSMQLPNELTLWHGTTAESVPNIVLGGFNRGYCGRHGTKLGSGTYFSASAGYSLRFCDRRRPLRMMLLSRVLAGVWARGEPGLVEAPRRDAHTRYDSTVDDTASPSMYCIFRDFQAVPQYLVVFEGGEGAGGGPS